jgi:hypothetical protein
MKRIDMKRKSEGLTLQKTKYNKRSAEPKMNKE